MNSFWANCHSSSKIFKKTEKLEFPVQSKLLRTFFAKILSCSQHITKLFWWDLILWPGLEFCAKSPVVCVLQWQQHWNRKLIFCHRTRSHLQLSFIRLEEKSKCILLCNSIYNVGVKRATHLICQQLCAYDEITREIWIIKIIAFRGRLYRFYPG